MESEMFGQSCCENKYFDVSRRNYLEDYGYAKSKKIDMTLSGTYLYKYPFKRIKKYRLDKYPNSKEKQILINSIRNKFKFFNSNYSVVLGPGSNGLIQNICKIILGKNTNLLTPYLSFGQAEFAANSFGAETRRVYLNDFKIDFDYFEKSIDEETKMIYICNPNNPTGFMLENIEIIDFAKKYPNIYIVIDESNIEFSKKKSLLEEELLPNLIILKSFSKAYGLSNLRIGYLVCDNDLYDEYRKKVTINEFPGISTYYANRAICSDMYEKNVRKINREINFLIYNLKKIGIETFDTFSNTLFTKTIFKREIMGILEKHDISLVPIIDQYNKLHFRIACQTHKINKKFIKELSKIYNIKEYIIE